MFEDNCFYEKKLGNTLNIQQQGLALNKLLCIHETLFRHSVIHSINIH